MLCPHDSEVATKTMVVPMVKMPRYRRNGPPLSSATDATEFRDFAIVEFPGWLATQ